MAFFPVRNRRTHTAEQAWARMVARAAPSTPMSKTKIKTGSRTMFTMAPRPTVSIPVLAKPWELMKGFRPRLTMTKRVPMR